VGELAQEQSLLLLRRLPLGDVDQHVHRADQLAFGIVQRCRKWKDRHASAVGTLDDLLGSAHWLAGLDGERRGAFLVRDWLSVGPVKLAGDRPGIVADDRMPTAKLSGSLVAEGDAAVGVGRVDGCGESLEQIAVPSFALLQALLGSFARGDVLEAIDAANELAGLVAQRVEIGENGEPAAIRSFEY